MSLKATYKITPHIEYIDEKPYYVYQQKGYALKRIRMVHPETILEDARWFRWSKSEKILTKTNITKSVTNPNSKRGQDELFVLIHRFENPVEFIKGYVSPNCIHKALFPQMKSLIQTCQFCHIVLTETDSVVYIEFEDAVAHLSKLYACTRAELDNFVKTIVIN